MNDKKHKTVEYGKYGYVFIAPFFVVFLIFQLYPLLYTFWLSFVEYIKIDMTQTIGPHFGGFKNFIACLVKTQGVQDNFKIVEGAKWFQTDVIYAIRTTLVMWILNFIPQILLSLLLAAWFTDTHIKLKGQGIFKILMYMPNVITASSIAVLFYTMFSISGPITKALKNVGIIKDQTYDFMLSARASVLLIAFMQFWMWYGNTMITLIAGILGINPSLYEAAMVDGANGRQQFFSITLPLLKPILQFTLVTSAIGGLQMYDIPSLFNTSGTSPMGQPFVNTSGSDGYFATETITMLIRYYGFTTTNYGRAAAASVILFIVTLLISMVFFILTKDRPDKVKHAVPQKGGTR
jgi:multiple sugar transport system permease protein